MIKIRGLNKTYNLGQPNALHVLKGIDMDVAAGEFLSIMGASGSGKSTLLNVIGILDNYDTGEYILDGTLVRDLSETHAAELRNRKVGFIFQSFNLISYKNAMENVALPLEINNYQRKTIVKRAEGALRTVDLLDKKDNKAKDLSGGEKQRLAIARAIVSQPKILFADEPTGNLDSINGANVEKMLFNYNRKTGATLIIVTHDEDLAKKCDVQIFLVDGKIAKISHKNSAKNGVKNA
jgi:putative ABC transport system ATP-binding protein